MICNDLKYSTWLYLILKSYWELTTLGSRSSYFVLPRLAFHGRHDVPLLHEQVTQRTGEMKINQGKNKNSCHGCYFIDDSTNTCSMNKPVQRSILMTELVPFWERLVRASKVTRNA